MTTSPSGAIVESPANAESAVGNAPSWTRRLLPFLDSGQPVGFAPARWGGSVSLENQYQRSGQVDPRNVTNVTVSLLAATYFWQPWFAQVRSNFTLLAGLDSTDRGVSVAGNPSSSTTNFSLSGGAMLTVFPSSRFPFLASFESSDSRTTGEFTPSDFRSTRASLRQSYRDPLGTTSFTGGLDYSLLDSPSFGRDSVVALDTRYFGTLASHRLDGALLWSRNRRSRGTGGSDIARAFGTHLYSPTPDLWVTSLASFVETDFDLGDTRLTQRVGQLTSQAVWRPGFDERIVVNGGGRILSNQVAGSGAGGTSHAISGNAGASFAVNEQATINASLNTNWISEANRDYAVTLGSVGANYLSRPVDLKFVSYSWNASAQAGSESGGEDGARTLAAVQAGHQLSHTLAMGKAVSLSLRASQDAGVREDSLVGRTDILRFTTSAGLRMTTSESSEAQLTATYGQSNTSGAIKEQFRLADVHASGNVRLGNFHSLSANLSAQWTESVRDGQAGQEGGTQLNGSVSYQHSRLFGVPRLRYALSAVFNEGLTETRLQGDVEGQRENVTRFIDQRIVYDIGRLEMRFGMRFARINDRDDMQWYLRLVRQFGMY